MNVSKLVSTKAMSEYKIPLGKNVTTGIIHFVMGGSSICGASRRNSLISLAHAERSPDSMYCQKCFGGKPAVFVEFECA